MTSSDKENLKRIRDNQRRSRARRRQYIRELEVQIESYKARGIEVTTEIQRAARRVVEQNKKMRALLNNLDFDNERISYFLRPENITLGPVDDVADIDLQGNQPEATKALGLMLIPHGPTNLDSETYLTAPPTSKVALGSSTSNGIASLSPEIPAAEISEQFQMLSNPSFPAPNTVDFSIQGVSQPVASDISTGELSQYPPILAELSSEQQFTKDLISIFQDDMSYGYEVNDDEATSYSGQSFTPKRTNSVTTGSVALCNSQSQSYEQLEYTSIAPCVDGDIGDDATPFEVSLNSGSRVLVWA
ncbi:hypothetical protein F4821DRAFT_1658 [Hypoxylon rubiginosum]|uniref:Uncharacterized protein n=1 Tax=Hypoxylon rubiginosum TaxID=110542 RepID=A0ACC0DLR6_9PEZI|nr:hypothetical protein F4821DRAFT_1658 [Hypoxylon rubiginosum]